jgi:hypothetical protein
MKGSGWVLEGGGPAFGGGGFNGTTLKWAAGTTGIITLNAEGPGIIRDLNLSGSEHFTGAERGVWDEAIMPDFTDQTGTNIFARPIQSMSRSGDVVAVLVNGISNEFNHTYVVGTQITISGISEHPQLNGLYYIINIDNTNPNAVLPTSVHNREPCRRPIQEYQGPMGSLLVRTIFGSKI